MGHDKVCMVDGGLKACIEAQVPLDSSPKEDMVFDREEYRAERNPDFVCSYEDVVKNSELPEEIRAQVLDARSRQRLVGQLICRFLGLEPEPRPGVVGGHMPFASNAHFREIISKDGYFLPKEQLYAHFMNLGAKLDKPFIVTCGSGVTAAILWVALRECGAHNVRLYDGSWSEYGAKKDAVICSHVESHNLSTSV